MDKAKEEIATILHEMEEGASLRDSKQEYALAVLVLEARRQTRLLDALVRKQHNGCLPWEPR
ncbi:hypothetical protein EVB87_069 [Rhizobium phage RHph_N28_1]|nr:hypothetical protein EVB87_069 [Rhizobium phage RHph_N28_1]QIG74097.1 hypothetical protein EVC07_069 [Rhizobium phage RHph_N42]QIG74703.1 hypothetical protein EVC12_068 [Rhizobium phage RHph_I42]